MSDRDEGQKIADWTLPAYPTKQKSSPMNVKEFNRMYGLPVGLFPGIAALPDRNALLRLVQLKRILQDEVNEIDEIIDLAGPNVELTEKEEVDVLVMLADLLVDLQVYAQSEMVKWGLPNEAIHEIVMESNASKLMADGSAQIIDGKLQKGPNYWKPEPRIRQVLLALRRAAQFVTA